MVCLKDIFCYSEDAPAEEASSAAEPVTDIRSYGRLKSRAFSEAQTKLLNERLPEISMTAADMTGAIFPEPKDGLFLEIGFGNGGHLVSQARNRPHHGFIGAEPFKNGLASCVRESQDLPADNLRLYNGDARELLRAAPPQFFDGVYILFPDPWPKTRHHKKRLIQGHFLQLLLTRIKPGGRLLIATDHNQYAEYITDKLSLCPEFVRMNIEAPGREPENWTRTKYQLKAKAEGREAEFFDMRAGAPL